MKIIQLVLGKANPERMNGINRIVHEIASSLNAAELDVELWGITETPQVVTPSRVYPLRLFHPGSSRWNLSSELESALYSLDQSAVVHLHGALLTQFAPIARILRHRDIPYVVTPHGSYTQEALKRNSLAKHIYISVADQKVMRGARAIQVNSAKEATDLEQRLRGVKTTVIPNGQRPLAAPNRALARELEFGFCGRLDAKHKGLDLLVDGFEKYRRSGGAGKLTLIGDGPDREMLKQRAASAQVAVEFVGPLFGQAKLERLSQCAVFVHTSRHEGMPMSVLEGAALGLPLLLSRETNLADEMLGADAGFVADPNTPKSIAASLSKAEVSWNAGKLRQLGDNALAMIESRFSWDEVARRLTREAYSLDLARTESA